MPSKYQITKAAAEVLKTEVFSNEPEYRRFLTTAAKNYKYGFVDQLLIFWQKPDAVACAGIDVWNRLGRWVNRGTKGIPLLDSSGTAGRLRYVFDLADTNSRAGRDVRLWNMEFRYEEGVMEALADSFNVPRTSLQTLPEFLEATAEVLVEDNYTDYLRDILKERPESLLEPLEEGDLELELKRTLKNSVTFMLLSRCGYDPAVFEDVLDFGFINLFDTPKVASVLGNAVSDISEMALREIGVTVKALEKAEKTTNRTFAKTAETGYDEAGRTKNERSEQYAGTDVPLGGRLPDSRSGGPGSPEDRQVRDPETQVSAEPAPGDLRRDAPGGQPESPSGADRPASQRDDGASDGADGPGRGRDRGAEGQGSDGLGESDEQHQEPGGGDRSERPDLRLEPEALLTVAEQQNTIAEAEAEQASAFAISQEDIDAVLMGGSHVSEGKFRIYAQYLKQEPAVENVKFLKNEYGTGGAYPAVIDREISEDHDSKGIRLRLGSIIHPDADLLLSWPKVEKRIKELIRDGRYLNSAEKNHFPVWRQEQALRRERAAVGKRIMDVIHDFNDFETQLGNKEALLNLYVLSDCASRLYSGDKITLTLRENNFVLPLLRDALNRIISEETHLTDRCRDALKELDGDLFKHLEPTYDELNPPPPPPREYRFSLGDKVFLGTQEYELLHLGEEEVRLYDPTFPLINKELSREDFDRMVAENPLNDSHYVLVESAPKEEIAPTSDKPDDSWLEKAKAAINEYCQREFGQDADYSDLHSVDLAFTTVTDAHVPVQASVDLLEFHLDRYAANVLVERRQYESLQDMISRELEFLDFDALTDFNDDEIEAAVEEAEQKKDAGQTPEAAATEMLQEPTGDDRLDEMLRQAELAVELSEQTGQNVFAFEEGNPNPVNLQEKPAEEKKLAPPVTVRRGKLTPTVLHPEIQNAQRHDYRIADDELGVGTPTERYFNNVTAIRLMKKLERENRLATPEEQTLLARYVGWGGLSACFEETSSHYQELKSLLTEEENSAARESTLTAFFTPPVVIRGIYQALEQMGFQRGNILEPSCGVGNFMGMLPDAMKDSKLYGVELDSISGRIARQLYQKASIAVQGFENTELPDSFFDAALGNVPFGQFKVADKRYDKHNFLIHDYFFAKTLDKVRPGGIVALITSKGTMDKENPAVRKYIAQRADLLGAIRLPNDTFKKAAGTDVTSDILFLQKRDRLIDQEPDWVYLDKDANGVTMNRYFVENPDMILGEMKTVSGPFGPETACVPYGDQSLGNLLSAAVQNIHADYTAIDVEELSEDEEEQVIPADPDVRNFSYTVVGERLYYRENSVMKPVELSLTGENRVKGMIGIRESVRRLIEYQTEDFPEEMIAAERQELNKLYDAFVKSYGILNSRANKSVFAEDNAASLLSSLEVLDDEGNFIRKADMFSKRTIRQKVVVTSVDTASEALALSLAEKAQVDMPYMMELTGKTEQEIAEDLEGVIFLNPMYGFGGQGEGRAKYLPADEYLSGNVREKLRTARKSAELSPGDYAVNVKALEQVQPKDLSAAEISVRLGATWVPPEIIEQFMFQLFSTPRYCQWNIKVHFSPYTGEWNIEGKSYDVGNVKANSTYGTDRISGYKIIEQTLNLKDVRIFAYIDDPSGKRVAVLNKKETAIAQGKQDLIKQAFTDWIWADPKRREKLCKLYNEKFNSIRPREYDGSHLNFVGMNPEIELKPHQLNAVAHILYGGNTLLAHVVGAGKTFEMVAAAQESKRLGLCQKSLIVVPNHLTEQWAAEYLQLYPAANILVATRKDFETKNRRRFCSRIATGDYDAIIIGHSQFEKIPMSAERQAFLLQKQIDEIMEGIAEVKRNRGDRFTIKQYEKVKKSLELKMSKLNDQSRKDNVVTFEELGVDRLFIDEAHYYKNLAAFSKMRNVGGISQTEAQKSSDLYMKCRYLDEITGGRGVVFATGTPISNSMVEMYTMQKYLQYGALSRDGLLNFDAWASTFGETVTAIELAPEGYTLVGR